MMKKKAMLSSEKLALRIKAILKANFELYTHCGRYFIRRSTRKMKANDNKGYLESKNISFFH